MRENVSVDEALKKGRMKLVYLPMVVTFGIIGLAFYIDTQHIQQGWVIPIGFLVGFVSGWLVWSYFVVEWKIWAYENVRNINELKRKAINEKLIWKDRSWLEKTEFKNYQQKQQLKHLEKKFLEKDIFHDDLSVPKETVIKYSKSDIILGFVICLGMIGVGIYFYIEDSGYLWLVFIVIGSFLSYQQIKKVIDKSPQIIINEKGIKLKDESLVTWNNIHEDQVYTRSSGKNSTNYLKFNNEQISISDLDVTFTEMENLLHVYRVRYEKNNAN